ncbi:hypothetical protein HYR99_25910 [Candidatus Poribacteria bacterium]|nr:hypothetical protein [Candidatus Poribacteria bacterium]
MAKRKRHVKKSLPRAQPQAQGKPFPLVEYALLGIVIVLFAAAGIAWYARSQRPKVEAKLLATLEQRVNRETAWGRKVSQNGISSKKSMRIGFPML